MKYIKSIFENQDVKDLAVANESLIQLATDTLLAYNVALESHILNNLDVYVVEGDLSATYEAIRNFVMTENINFINQSSAILCSNSTDKEKSEVFESSMASISQAASNMKKGIASKANSAAASVGAIGRGAKKYRMSTSELASSGKKRIAATAGAAAVGAGAATMSNKDK